MADRIQHTPVSGTDSSTEKPTGKRLLVVDKPRFSRLIHRMLAGRYDVICVDDAPSALQAMRYNRPDAVVADFSVRGGGLRLIELMEMNERFAHTPFILMCMKPTSDLVERAKQSGVDSFLVKPFPPSGLIDLLGLVQSKPTRRAPIPESEEEEERGLAEKIEEKMQSIDGLPPFPATHAKIMELANSDASDAVANQIQMDPSFLASVLKLSNSAHYGFTRQVDSLKLAVTLLGFEEISNLVMSLQVFQEMGDYERESAFDQAAFWKHSVGTAFIARAIAQQLSTEVEVAFMGGLLHDIGKVVLDRFFTEFYA
ncbi:MAG: HDOD domain-containing protein, partial [Candidatus Latescibacteria bacterium]|nr:HDOD domain-containing protein [Candidatus Latescibacterota bacterium]